jgi:type IV pilus assembly protein PilW
MNLIEIMIAMSLSLILMAGVFHIMISSKRTYGLQGELAGLQENARFLVDEMNYNLRMGGYFGCSGSPPAGMSFQPFTGSTDGQQTAAKLRVAVKDAQQTYQITTKTTTKNVPSSDTLVLSYLGEQIQLPNWSPAAITTAFGNVTNQFIFDANDSIIPSVGSNVIISDCGGGETYKVNAVNTGTFTITLDRSLQRAYRWPVEVFATAQPTRYEVVALDKNGNGDADDPEDGFGLFKFSSERPNGELFIEGVENLQMRYGIDTDGDGAANRYDSVPSGGTVVSVRITLLMRTPNRRYDIYEAQNTDFDLDTGVTYNPSAHNFEIGYRHRLFSTIVQIRNS